MQETSDGQGLSLHAYQPVIRIRCSFPCEAIVYFNARLLVHAEESACGRKPYISLHIADVDNPHRILTRTSEGLD